MTSGAGTPVEWLHPELDTAGFDAAPFRPVMSAAERAGITFTTLAALGDSPADARYLMRRIHRMRRAVPGRESSVPAGATR